MFTKFRILDICRVMEGVIDIFPDFIYLLVVIALVCMFAYLCLKGEGPKPKSKVVNIDTNKMELISREETEGEIKEIYRDGNREVTVIARCSE